MLVISFQCFWWYGKHDVWSMMKMVSIKIFKMSPKSFTLDILHHQGDWCELCWLPDHPKEAQGGQTGTSLRMPQFLFVTFPKPRRGKVLKGRDNILCIICVCILNTIFFLLYAYICHILSYESYVLHMLTRQELHEVVNGKVAKLRKIFPWTEDVHIIAFPCQRPQWNCDDQKHTRHMEMMKNYMESTLLIYRCYQEKPCVPNIVNCNNRTGPISIANVPQAAV